MAEPVEMPRIRLDAQHVIVSRHGVSRRRKAHGAKNFLPTRRVHYSILPRRGLPRLAGWRTGREKELSEGAWRLIGMKLLALMLVGIALAGCTGHATPRPTATNPATATAQASPPATPAATSTPNGDLVPREAAHGPLVVYASRLPSSGPGVTYEVVALDTQSGQRWASFRCAVGCGEAQLAPDGSVYFSDKSGIERRRFSDSAPTPFFSLPAGRQLSGFAVSRSGDLVAVALEGDSPATFSDGEVLILRSAPGESRWLGHRTPTVQPRRPPPDGAIFRLVFIASMAGRRRRRHCCGSQRQGRIRRACDVLP